MKEKMKHTPGPWTIGSDGSGPTINAGGGVVALVNTDEPDARLIAAAPELLEALKSMAGWFSGKESDNYYTKHMPGNLCADLETARAAIAKATGSSAQPQHEPEKILVEVRGGCAYCDDPRVNIVDHDNEGRG